MNTLLHPAEASDLTNPASGGARKHGYAYSFDRETFRGCHATRIEAVAAAEETLATYSAPVEAIWVGRITQAEPPVEQLGELVLNELADRQADEGVEAVVANEDARDELDARLASLLRAWMDDYGLLAPRGVESVSEHPIRVVPHVNSDGEAGREISLIGDVG